MKKFEELIAVIHRHLDKPSTSWSIGSFGAIAEFHRSEPEAVVKGKGPEGGFLISDKGAIRLNLEEDVVPVPYEVLRGGKNSWLHGVIFCLAGNAGSMSRRTGLTELGPDDDAMREQDRGSVLFDMGLGLPQVDVCVRTNDPALIETLREQSGAPVLEPDNPAMSAIKEASPHRVFMSPLGRLEVFQRIGSSAKGIPTPHGPHTHVLPRLLTHRRTHAANIPVPDGCVPCLAMYPANPVSDDMGNLRPFDQDDHRNFQNLLERYGDPATVRLKQRTIDAVRKGENPKADGLGKFERTALRVALRQLHWTDGETATLTDWQAAFEPAVKDEDLLADGGH